MEINLEQLWILKALFLGSYSLWGWQVRFKISHLDFQLLLDPVSPNTGMFYQSQLHFLPTIFSLCKENLKCATTDAKLWASKVQLSFMNEQSARNHTSPLSYLNRHTFTARVPLAQYYAYSLPYQLTTPPPAPYSLHYVCSIQLLIFSFWERKLYPTSPCENHQFRKGISKLNLVNLILVSGLELL